MKNFKIKKITNQNKKSYSTFYSSLLPELTTLSKGEIIGLILINYLHNFKNQNYSIYKLATSFNLKYETLNNGFKGLEEKGIISFTHDELIFNKEMIDNKNESILKDAMSKINSTKKALQKQINQLSKDVSLALSNNDYDSAKEINDKIQSLTSELEQETNDSTPTPKENIKQPETASNEDLETSFNNDTESDNTNDNDFTDLSDIEEIPNTFHDDVQPQKEIENSDELYNNEKLMETEEERKKRIKKEIEEINNFEYSEGYKTKDYLKEMNVDRSDLEQGSNNTTPTPKEDIKQPVTASNEQNNSININDDSMKELKKGYEGFVDYFKPQLLEFMSEEEALKELKFYGDTYNFEDDKDKLFVFKLMNKFIQKKRKEQHNE